MNEPISTDRVSNAGWAAALDDLDALIDRQQDVLDRGEVIDTDLLDTLRFAPPDGLPPLPPELAARARHLFERTAALVADARDAADRTRPAVLAARPARRVAATFDRRA